jgi:DNA mismatch repair protein MutS2
LVVATTHYAELKTYAHNTPAARNASVEFDLATLSPTYRLSIGLPGTSQAFAIAERLGLPAELVADARSRLSRGQQEFEQTLASIKAAQQTAEDALARATAAESRAREERRTAAEERARARAEREAAMAVARDEAERALAEIRSEIHAAREMLARETVTEPRLDEAMARLEARVAQLLPGDGQQGDQPASAPAAEDFGHRFRPGDRVRARDGWQGTLAEVDEGTGQATLEAGAMRVVVPIDQLELQPAGGRTDRLGDPPPFGSGVPAGTSPRAVPATLDVRGARVEEAIDMVERYVDQASLAGAPRVTVVHGFGSGALRDALRSLLSSHALVRTWRPGERGEGGDGATIVEF